jgi:hypothetical protein
MPYTPVDPTALPIERDTARATRIQRNLLIGTTLFAAVASTVIITWVLIANHAALSLFWPVYLVPVSSWLIPLLIWRFFGRGAPDRLTIDAHGVRFTRDKQAYDFEWQSVGHTKQIVTNPGGRTPILGVQLQRKGAFYTKDDIVDFVVPGQFGLTIKDFRAIVDAGIGRWGGATAAI